MKMTMQDSMALCRRFGNPSLFLTFTCDPLWPEIASCIEPGMEYQDYPDIICRVFKQSLDELMKDLIERKIFGRVVASSYVIEFQKRGLPHAHIVLILSREDRITTKEQVDAAVRADIPDQSEDPVLYELVMKHMVHPLCGRHRGSSCIDPSTKKCTKGFPKVSHAITSHYKPVYVIITVDDVQPIREETDFVPMQGYPQYRRPARGPISDDDPRDNSYVVPYSPYLLKKYRCHFNVEACAGIEAIQYLYKYIYKGPAAATFTAHRLDGNKDEIVKYMDGRWIGSVEACWRLFGFSMGKITPAVYRLPVHLPGEQLVVFQPNSDLPDRERLSRTPLTEFLALNEAAEKGLVKDYYQSRGVQVDEPLDPRQYLYFDMPEYFTWVTNKRVWKPRQKQNTIGRVYFVGPKAGDLFYLRLMIHNVPGPTSFEDICTVNGITYRRENSTWDFQAACNARGLCQDDRELHTALQEVASLDVASSVRRLFVAILIHSRPTNPRALWEEHASNMSTDCQHILQREYPTVAVPASSSEEDNDFRVFYHYQFCLFLLQQLLEKQEVACSLETFDLPPVTVNFNEYHREPNPLIREELNYDINDDELQAKWDSLNHDQRIAADTILNAVITPQPGSNLFFLTGPGGTGKTHVENSVLDNVRQLNRIALAVASSGIAACLLHGGTTAHAKFKIPLDADTLTTCNVSKGTNLAGLLRQTELIFWDEAPMQNRFDMQAVDKVLRDLCLELDDSPDTFFAGKVTVFCGDFRQTLPVSHQGGPGGSIFKSLKSSPFWHQVRVLRLTENMRLRDPNLTDLGREQVAQFADRLIEIGDGFTVRRDAPTRRDLAHWPYGWIPDNSRETLIDKIYGRLDQLGEMSNHDANKYLSERAILAITNYDVARINEQVFRRMKGQSRIFWSRDAARNQEEEGQYPPEYWNAVDQPSIAPHRLTLKIGMVVMVIRNMEPPRVCNGTRLKITHIGEKVVVGEILNGQYAGEQYHAHRIKMVSKENDHRLPCVFTRLQFPLRPAFALTVNKSQGQSLKYVGIDLQVRPCFCHGQLYVALSRTSRMQNLYLIGPDNPEDLERQELVNIVHKVILDHG